MKKRNVNNFQRQFSIQIYNSTVLMKNTTQQHYQSVNQMIRGKQLKLQELPPSSNASGFQNSKGPLSKSPQAQFFSQSNFQLKKSSVQEIKSHGLFKTQGHFRQGSATHFQRNGVAAASNEMIDQVLYSQSGHSGSQGRMRALYSGSKQNRKQDKSAESSFINKKEPFLINTVDAKEYVPTSQKQMHVEVMIPQMRMNTQQSSSTANYNSHQANFFAQVPRDRSEQRAKYWSQLQTPSHLHFKQSVGGYIPFRNTQTAQDFSKNEKELEDEEQSLYIDPVSNTQKLIKELIEQLANGKQQLQSLGNEKGQVDSQSRARMIQGALMTEYSKDKKSHGSSLPKNQSVSHLKSRDQVNQKTISQQIKNQIQESNPSKQASIDQMIEGQVFESGVESPLLLVHKLNVNLESNENEQLRGSRATLQNHSSAKTSALNLEASQTSQDQIIIEDNQKGLNQNQNFAAQGVCLAPNIEFTKNEIKQQSRYADGPIQVPTIPQQQTQVFEESRPSSRPQQQMMQMRVAVSHQRIDSKQEGGGGGGVRGGGDTLKSKHPDMSNSSNTQQIHQHLQNNYPPSEVTSAQNSYFVSAFGQMEAHDKVCSLENEGRRGHLESTQNEQDDKRVSSEKLAKGKPQMGRRNKGAGQVWKTVMPMQYASISEYGLQPLEEKTKQQFLDSVMAYEQAMRDSKLTAFQRAQLHKRFTQGNLKYLQKIAQYSQGKTNIKNSLLQPLENQRSWKSLKKSEDILSSQMSRSDLKLSQIVQPPQVQITLKTQVSLGSPKLQQKISVDGNLKAEKLNSPQLSLKRKVSILELQRDQEGMPLKINDAHTYLSPNKFASTSEKTRFIRNNNLLRELQNQYQLNPNYFEVSIQFLKDILMAYDYRKLSVFQIDSLKWLVENGRVDPKKDIQSAIKEAIFTYSNLRLLQLQKYQHFATKKNSNSSKNLSGLLPSFGSKRGSNQSLQSHISRTSNQRLNELFSKDNHQQHLSLTKQSSSNPKVNSHLHLNQQQHSELHRYQGDRHSGERVVVVDDEDEIFGTRKKSKFSQASQDKRSSVHRSMRESTQGEEFDLGAKRRSLQEVGEQNYLSQQSVIHNGQQKTIIVEKPKEPRIEQDTEENQKGDKARQEGHKQMEAIVKHGQGQGQVSSSYKRWTDKVTPRTLKLIMQSAKISNSQLVNLKQLRKNKNALLFMNQSPGTDKKALLAQYIQDHYNSQQHAELSHFAEESVLPYQTLTSPTFTIMNIQQHSQFYSNPNILLQKQSQQSKGIGLNEPSAQLSKQIHSQPALFTTKQTRKNFPSQDFTLSKTLANFSKIESSPSKLQNQTNLSSFKPFNQTSNLKSKHFQQSPISQPKPQVHHYPAAPSISTSDYFSRTQAISNPLINNPLRRVSEHSKGKQHNFKQGQLLERQEELRKVANLIQKAEYEKLFQNVYARAQKVSHDEVKRHNMLLEHVMLEREVLNANKKQKAKSNLQAREHFLQTQTVSLKALQSTTNQLALIDQQHLEASQEEAIDFEFIKFEDSDKKQALLEDAARQIEQYGSNQGTPSRAKASQLTVKPNSQKLPPGYSLNQQLQELTYHQSPTIQGQKKGQRNVNALASINSIGESSTQQLEDGLLVDQEHLTSVDSKNRQLLGVKIRDGFQVRRNRFKNNQWWLTPNDNQLPY